LFIFLFNAEMIHNRYILLFSFLFFLVQVSGQTGQWKDYFSYASPTKICISEEFAYCLANQGLFSVSLNDGTVEKISKVTGLSDVSISSLAYCKSQKTLIIGYKNGNIDLYTKGKIFNINDLKNKTGISAKEIYKIVVDGNSAYLCCAFGVVLVNIENQEIKDSYQFGISGSAIKVYDICMNDGMLYAATESGLYSAKAGQANLADFNAWSRVTSIPSYTLTFKNVESFQNKLVAVYTDAASTTDQMGYWTGSSWIPVAVPSTSIRGITALTDSLLVSGGSNLLIYNSNFNLQTTDALSAPFDAAKDAKATIWVADSVQGLVAVSPSGTINVYKASSPASNDVSRIAAYNGKIWIAAGSKSSSNWGPIYRAGEVYYFDGTTWQDFNKTTVPLFSYFSDICNVIINPSNTEQAFAAGWTFGFLAQFDKGVLSQTWNDKNSTLKVRNGSGMSFSKIFGMCFDSNNNLWVTNSGLPNTIGDYPISVKTSANKWHAFNYGNAIGANLTGDIIATSNNLKWVILPNGNGLFVFDEKKTFDTDADDQYTRVSVTDSNGDLISNDIYSIAEDHDGNIWVGTNAGPVVYYNPGGVFTGTNFYASKIKIPRKDEPTLADYLLDNERVTSILVDGANRKWLGTVSSGVFLMSADGTKQLFHFTSSNSPLPSNVINSMAIDNTTGEVFFATDAGMVSYKGQATEGGEDFGKVYVYPNPVRENYQGDIVVTGLIEDTQVRITDISGNLVYSCSSLGGQAIWNGRTFDGRKVNTGIYLVFCSSKDGSKTKVTKLLFIH
jgi:hypothetical protein